MHAGAEYPNCGIGSVRFINPTLLMSMCDYSSQKRLRGLDHMGKSNGPLSLLYRFKSVGDWLARSDALQNFR